MWNALRRYRFGAISLLLSLLAGCQEPPQAFLVETTIHADGSCRRSIYQPKEGYLPLEAVSLDWIGQWESISGATAPSDKTPPSQRQSGLALSGAKYFVAEGTFSSPRDIPAHYRYVAKGAGVSATGVSELVREYQRTDFGLLVEYRWSERLTNSVTLDRFLVARDELLDLLLPIVVRAMEKRFGKEYDVSGLAEYLRRDGRRFAEDIALGWYCAAVAEPSLVERKANSIILPTGGMFRRHGVEVADDLDWTTDEGWAEFEHILKSFALKIIGTNVKHRDGRLLSEADAKQFLARIVEPRDAPAAPNGNIVASETPYEPLDPATEAKIDVLLTQIMGAYPWLRIFGGGEEFEFSLRLPGRVIGSNGVLHEDGRVSWKFGSGEAYPTGYEMMAVGLDINVEIQRKVLGRVAIADTSDALKFINLVGHKGRLLYVVRSLFETGDKSALRDLKAESPDELKRLNAVRSMLHIESDGKRDAG